MYKLFKGSGIDAVLVTRPIAQALKHLFESYRLEINRYLKKGGYKHPNSNKPIELAEILVGVDPSSKLIKTYPSIAITMVSENVAWAASMITDESITARIYCMVQLPVIEQRELLMYDLTDICRSILIKHQVLPFYMEYDNAAGDPIGELHGPSVATPSIQYGSLNSDNVRAGQIDWTAELILHHPNLIFGSLEP